MSWQEDKWGQWVPVDELTGAGDTLEVLLASRSLPKNLNPSREACFGTRLSATKRSRARRPPTASPGSLTS